MTQIQQIGIVLGLDYEVGRAVLRGVISYARPGKPWVFRFLQESPRLVSSPESRQIDGFIGSLAQSGITEAFLGLGKPGVNVSNHRDCVPMPTVVTDDVTVGRLAARHFLDRGYRRFAFFGQWETHYRKEREQGFTAELAAASPDGPPEFSSYLSWCAQQGKTNPGSMTHVQEWVKTLPRSTAVLAVNDRAGWVLSEICRQNDVSVPEAIAILSVDNDMPICMAAYPQLSSIATSGERIGYEAARKLDQLLQGAASTSERLLVPPKAVITRRSTNTLAIEDPELARAVNFIRDSAARSIDVEEVVAAVGIARRSLERKFRMGLGRTPLEEIRRAHLDRAQELLMSTDLPMPAIAAQSGFESAVRLTTVFREMTGTTPTSFRRQYRLHDGEEGDVGEMGEAEAVEVTPSADSAAV